ncbi:RNA polymerase sigma factor [Novipirellula artificiosorum]|uniref:ECF RNA polymerase sigma factor SigW n=1 Tax=Novipirellula artificiosorum TaxID=2528016 RepID=A0A5C6DR22_9BACT|nr:RNA polymerase sigma factor [Novipirellula artificiosorum]TWU38634.1 ECF RNA polymerase sigma factor SigW [Novipirellula artificiosorum]
MDLQESIDRFGSPLTGLLVSWGVPAFDAAELAQDSLADAHLSLASCRGDVNEPLVFGRWLRGIAKNKFRAWSRSRSRRQRLAAAAEPELLDRITSETIVIDERLLRLRNEIQRLPNKHREVILMHYLDETPVVEVAALLSISVKAVEGRLYQARKKLRTQMDEPTNWTQVAKAVLL